MIYDGSCDNVDWSKVAITREILFLIYKKCNFEIVKKKLQFFCIFDQIMAALISIRDFFQKRTVPILRAVLTDYSLKETNQTKPNQTTFIITNSGVQYITSLQCHQSSKLSRLA